jgi:hypothetical protein
MTKHFALVDDQLVEDTLFLRRFVGEPILKRPEPVIASGEALGSVLLGRDGLWRMWYAAFYTLDPKKDLVGCETPLHYATSRDGLNWELPDLGLYKKENGRRHNIVIGSHQKDKNGRSLTGYGGVAGFVVLDSELTPHPVARSRYTAMYHSSPSDTYGGIGIASSDDGITWTAWPENPVLPGNQDTQNCFFFDKKTGKYVCFERPMIYCGVAMHANRKLARLESDDLVHWTPNRVCLDTDERDAPAFDIYQEPGMGGYVRGRTKQFQGISPFPYNDTYLGLTWFYDVRSGVFTSELVRSDDSKTWKREALREPFIDNDRPKGFRGKLPVPMGSPPVPVGDELYFYFSNTPHGHHATAEADITPDKAHRKELLEENSIYALAIKRDRWVGYEAPPEGDHEGELLTTPFKWMGGGRLLLNLTIRDGGYVKVSFEDRWGRPIGDYHLDEIPPINGPVDAVDHPLTFGPGPKTVVKLPDAASAGVRLRFFLKRATLWGWTAEGPERWW